MPATDEHQKTIAAVTEPEVAPASVDKEECAVARLLIQSVWEQAVADV